MNYYELYDLPVRFSVDEGQVKRKFYELSKAFHPDFHVNETPEKQQEILQLSTENNKAYQVLSNPLKRIPYVLELHGLLEEGEKYQLPQSFLMDMMDVNEALMELEFDPDPTVLETISKQVDGIERSLFDDLKAESDAFDASSEPDRTSSLLRIKDIWFRQKYLLRIRETLNRFASR